jgi:Holliday junction resolvase RusA-like endonuclease
MIVLDIAEMKIASINKKFCKARNGRLYLSPEYRGFKIDLIKCMRSVKILPPYSVSIELKTPTDIDAPIKAIFDALEKKGIIDNDKNILDLKMRKIIAKRGSLGSIKIDVEGEIA